MFTNLVTVTVISVTEEHLFSALDRHGRDTNEIPHYLELVLNSHITILGIEDTILMIQALILNPTLRYDLSNLLRRVVGFQFQLIEMRV